MLKKMAQEVIRETNAVGKTHVHGYHREIERRFLVDCRGFMPARDPMEADDKDEDLGGEDADGGVPVERETR